MAPTMSVPALLLEHDVEPAPLLAEFGLVPADFDEPDVLLSYTERSRLLVRCAERARCPHFGLLVGQRAGLSSFGLVGFLMQSAPTVRAALEAVVQFFPLHNPNATTEVIESGGYVSFGHTILRHDGPGLEHVVDLSAAIMVNALRALCGYGGQPVELRLARGRPEDVTPYQRFFQVPLVFDSRDTGLLAPSSWFDRPVPTTDPLLHRMLRQRIADLVSGWGEGLTARVRRTLPSLLAGGESGVGGVARGLGLSTRTLNRRLAAEGTSFAGLRDETRYATARQMLAETAMPVGEIATQLGYANASAFTTAFRRWAGVAPASWRAAHRRGLPMA
jgi:AraC-like DNA-binding protein